MLISEVSLLFSNNNVCFFAMAHITYKLVSVGRYRGLIKFRFFFCGETEQENSIDELCTSN